MKRHAIPCLAVLCRYVITLCGYSAIPLLIIGSAQASQFPERSVGQKWLGGDNPALQGYEGYALRRILPISELPQAIDFKKGDVSLVADSTDWRGEYMVVYLVNDTDNSLPRVIGELRAAKTQVRVGKFWLCDRLDGVGCGSVAPPKDLPAGNALALGAWHSRKGNLRTQRRFVFDLADRRIASAPIPGVFFMANVEAMMVDDRSALLDAAMRRLFSNKWDDNYPVANPEEFVAFLDLARHHSQFIEQRQKLLRWVILRKQKGDTSAEVSRALDGIIAVLEKPWLANHDGQFLANRCIAALRGPRSNEYGSPDKCVNAVWHYISYTRLGLGPMRFRSESVSPDDRSLYELGRLAAKVMTYSSDNDEIEAAGSFLLSHSLAERHYSSDHFRKLLSTADPVRCRIGLGGLALRGMADEAGWWLSRHFNELGAETGPCYELTTRGMAGPLRDWEYPLVGYLLESDPLRSLSRLPTRINQLDKARIPGDWLDSLRKFLEQEQSPSRRAWWTSRAEISIDSQRDSSIATDVRSLTKALEYVDRWGDSSDVERIRAYVDHPAAYFEQTGDGFGKLRFVARATAWKILERRWESPPPDPVTEKLIITANRKSERPRWMALRELKSGEIVGFLAGIAFAFLLWVFLIRPVSAARRRRGNVSPIP